MPLQPDDLDQSLGDLSPRVNQTDPADYDVALVGPSVRAAAQSAAIAGLRVWAIDQFGDRDTRRLCVGWSRLDQPADWPVDAPDKSKGQQQARRSLMIVGGLGIDTAGSIPLLSDRFAIAGPSRSTRAELDDPGQLSALAKESGFEFPETVSLLAAPNRWPQCGRWLIRIRPSSGGLGIRWLPDHQRRWTPNIGQPTAEQSLVLQRYIPGKRLGISFFHDGHQTWLLGVCRGITKRLFPGGTKHPFAYAGSVGPLTTDEQDHAKLVRLGQLIAIRHQLRGLFNVDAIRDRQGRWWLLEINARWSASMEVLQSTRFKERSLIQAHLSVQNALEHVTQGPTNRLEPSTAAEPERVWKRVAFSRRSGHFDTGSLLAMLGDRRIGWTGHDLFQESSLRNPAPVAIRWADIPEEGSRIESGNPILTILIRYSAENEILGRLKRRLLRAVQQSVR